MFHSVVSRLLVAVAITTATHAVVAADAAPAPVQLSIVKTAEARTLEALTYSGGSYVKPVKLQHIAVLVRHPQGTLLFDTGLGRQVDAQVKADMPLWARPLFAAFGPVNDARSQLDAAGVPPVQRIVLSHVHWDHASGLVDFPEAQVWLPQQERDYMAHPDYLAVFPSQVSAPTIQWKPFQWENKPYEGFAQSLDLFGDASVVLVPLPGHTPGSTGMFVNLASGKQFLFVGDTVWRADAIGNRRPKMWISSKVVDNNAPQTLQAVGTLADLQAAKPGLVIVPAHDADVHDTMDAYFPKSVQ